VTNEVKDNNQLSKMSKRAKDILGVDELEMTADKENLAYIWESKI
jgi:hypothetical protein